MKVQMRGSYEGKVFDERELEFVIGDGYECNIVDGVEIAILSMRRNEKAKFFISNQYAFKQVRIIGSVFVFQRIDLIVMLPQSCI